MNKDLQNLEIKVENNGVTPQGRVSATEWNIVVSALKDLDLGGAGLTAEDVIRIVKNEGFATADDVGAVDTRLNDFLAGADTDDIINKWKELEDVLYGFKESDNLATILSGKADSATTLAGYGITDAYTKKAVDDALAKYVLLDTAQSISAIHDFTNGLLIGGLPIKKSQDKTIYIDGNLVVSGAITMFGKDSTTFPTIWANIPFNPDHMSWDGSQWSVVGGGGASVTKDSVINALGYTPYNATNPAGYITSNVNGPISASAYKLNADISNSGIYRGDYWTSALSNNDIAVIGERTAIISNVSIGGWEASAKLHVHGNANITSDATFGGRVYVGGDFFIHHSEVGKQLNICPNFTILGAANLTNGNPTYIDGHNVYIRYANDTAISSFLSNGNVAVGGSTADEKFHVHGIVKASGVKIETNDIAGFTIYRTNDIYSAVHFYNTQNGQKVDVGYLGATANRKPVYIDSGGANYDLLHSNNYSTYALPLSGGTINGNLTANRYWANNGFVFNNFGSDFCGLINGSTLTSTGNAKDIWLYNSVGNIQIYTPNAFSVNVQANVAVGGITASEKLSVYGNVALASGSANPYISIKDDTGAMWYVQYARDCLWFGLGTAKSLSVDRGGNVTTIGAITMFSQASLKNIINREGLSLDELAKIRPARFKWKDGRDERVHVGVIAENILPILPEVVYFTGEEKTKTVDYASLATHIGVSLIQPVVNLAERVKYLEAEVRALKEENKQLKQRAS